MIDLKLNSSTDLRKEGKSFFWASFFLPKSYKKNAGSFIFEYFDDIADKHTKTNLTILKTQLRKLKIIKTIR